MRFKALLLGKDIHSPSQNSLKARFQKSSDTGNLLATAGSWMKVHSHTGHLFSAHSRMYCLGSLEQPSQLWQILPRHVLIGFLDAVFRRRQCQMWKCKSSGMPCQVWLVQEPISISDLANFPALGWTHTSLTTMPPRLWAMNRIGRSSQP